MLPLPPVPSRKSTTKADFRMCGLASSDRSGRVDLSSLHSCRLARSHKDDYWRGGADALCSTTLSYYVIRSLRILRY